jgi:hypothetical protein
MALEQRQVLTTEELKALYARLNDLIDHARQMQRRLGKAIGVNRLQDPQRAMPGRRSTLARRTSREPKSRN